MKCTAPLNIKTAKSSICNLKCSYWFKYGNSTCNIVNNKEFLTIKYDGQGDVLYNTSTYTPTDVHIFKPALHAFDGEKADAELIIVHTNPEGGLLVCIPITSSDSTTSAALTEIIKGAPQQSDPAKVLNVNNFNLNDFVPKSSYYSYTGNPAWDCKSTSVYDYVVFEKSNPILLKADVLKKLDGLISGTSVNQADGKSFFNELGTTENGFQGDGQIYIDCQPTGESGEIIYKETSNGKSAAQSDIDTTKTQKFLLTMLAFIAGIVLMFVLFQVATTILTSAPDEGASEEAPGLFQQVMKSLTPKM